MSLCAGPELVRLAPGVIACRECWHAATFKFVTESGLVTGVCDQHRFPVSYGEYCES